MALSLESMSMWTPIKTTRNYAVTAVSGENIFCPKEAFIEEIRADTDFQVLHGSTVFGKSQNGVLNCTAASRNINQHLRRAAMETAKGHESPFLSEATPAARLELKIVANSPSFRVTIVGRNFRHTDTGLRRFADS